MEYSFESLGVAPEEYNVLLSEPPSNYGPTRQKLAEICFETFSVPAMYLAVTEMLALMSSGTLTGLAASLGHGTTNVVPIYEGYILKSSTRRTELGGQDLDYYLASELNKRGFVFDRKDAMESMLLSKMKEHVSSVSSDITETYEQYRNDPESFKKTFVLPDGTPLTFGEETFMSGEVLFNPSLIRREVRPIDDIFIESIESTNVDTRKPMFENIYLFGGLSKLPGLDKRLENALTPHAAESVNVSVKLNPEREYAAWYGGSILGSLPQFNVMAFNSEEYEELGPEGIKKCAMYVD